jgi:hypothetical protein
VQVNTNNPSKKGVRRGEFIEALIRVAKLKFVDTKIEPDLVKAFEKLIDENMKVLAP